MREYYMRQLCNNMILNDKYRRGGGDEGIRTLETIPRLLP